MLYRIYYIMSVEEDKNTAQAPNFDSHMPELINQYVHIRSNIGPGALCISFEAETGNCQTYYVKTGEGPPELKELYDKVDSECKPSEQTPVILIFHDSDKTFLQGQVQSFKLSMEEKEKEKEEETSEAVPP